MAADSLHDLTDVEIIKDAKFDLSSAERSGQFELARWATTWGDPAIEALEALHGFRDLDPWDGDDDPKTFIAQGRADLADELREILEGEPPKGEERAGLAARLLEQLAADFTTGDGE